MQTVNSRYSYVACSLAWQWFCGARAHLKVDYPRLCIGNWWIASFSKQSSSNKYEKLWGDLLADPSNWWDNRAGKQNPRFPDFKHKQTGDALWVIDRRNPPWVASRIASISTGISVFSWAQTLSRYNKAGQYEKTMELFKQMKKQSMYIDEYVFVPVLSACAALLDLEEGRWIHRQTIETGCEFNIYVSTSLINMYTNCRSMADALRVFDKIPTRDLFAWNAMILGCVKCGQGLKALGIFRDMLQDGIEPDSVTFVGVLNACSSIAALEDGRRVHKQVIQSGCECDVYVGNSLVDMYAKCGSLDDASRVFDNMLTRDVVGWTAMILGFVKCGEGLKALEYFQQMQQEGTEPDAIIFVGILNACASIGALEKGRLVHEQIKSRGCDGDVYVGSSLVNMYAKCGSIDDALRVLRCKPTSNVVSWNSLILGCVKSGFGLKALYVFRQMQEESVEPNSVTFIGMLNACASIAALEEGRLIHQQIIQIGCEYNEFVANSLVDMYAKCGCLVDAQRVFDTMPTHDLVGWNAIILGSVKCGQGMKALEIFEQMQEEGVGPDSVTFVGLLKACASIEKLEEGRHVHKLIIQSGCGSNMFICNSLVDMYAKCGCLDDAQRVFDKMLARNLVSWNAMILGCVKCGEGLLALQIFQQMELEGVKPDSVTFVGLLNACASIEELEVGWLVHERIMQSGCEFDVHVGNSLVDMYAKCGSLDNAWRVFDKMHIHDVVGWTAMILGCVSFGEGVRALEIFQQMQQEGVKPDSVAFAALLNACASIAGLEEGKRIHKQVIQSGYKVDVCVGNSLVNMYAKCGSLDDAWREFDKMPSHDVVGWNAIILGCVKCGEGMKALAIFQQMQEELVEPDSVTYMGLLNACASIAALERGRCVHEDIIWSGCECDVYLGSSLVDMYAKCGSLEDAQTVFDCMTTHNVASWNAMIMGYAMHGFAKEAVELFEEMLQAGREPDEVTFICLLSACSHGGLVKEGMQYFESMSSVYGVSPTLEHYTCLVDILGRSGRLNDAEEMLQTMPLERSVAAWMSLLAACRIHGNMEMGQRASKIVVELLPENASGYALLSNIYAAAGHASGTEVTTRC